MCIHFNVSSSLFPCSASHWHSVARRSSATTHWSAAGSINQCAEQSAAGLIQSPLQQKECVFTPLLRLRDLCESFPPPPKQSGKRQQIKSIMERGALCKISVATFPEVGEMTVRSVLSFSVEGVEVETKKKAFAVCFLAASRDVHSFML